MPAAYDRDANADMMVTLLTHMPCTMLSVIAEKKGGEIENHCTFASFDLRISEFCTSQTTSHRLGLRADGLSLLKEQGGVGVVGLRKGVEMPRPL